MRNLWKVDEGPIPFAGGIDLADSLEQAEQVKADAARVRAEAQQLRKRAQAHLAALQAGRVRLRETASVFFRLRDLYGMKARAR